MIKKFLLIILLSLPFSVNARPLDSDISQDEILIDARFSGDNLFLFGARNLAGDVVVIVRGPKQNYIVRKKEKFAGVWLNRKQMKFYDIYGFYDIYSTIPLSEIRDELLLKNLNIGLDNLPMEYRGEAYIEEIEDFKEAILDVKYADELYHTEAGEVEFMGDTLFKTHLTFPKKIPHGMYNAEIYLIDDNKLVGLQTFPVEVRRTGFEAFIYDIAHNNSPLYGLICVLAALFAGWFASMIFWKV